MNSEHFDEVEFLDRVQDDKELLLELIDMFFEDYKEKRASLDDAISASDFNSIKELSHAVKGASGNISAKQLREVVAAMETFAKSQNMDEIKKKILELDDSFNNLSACVDELKKKYEEEGI